MISSRRINCLCLSLSLPHQVSQTKLADSAKRSDYSRSVVVYVSVFHLSASFSICFLSYLFASPVLIIFLLFSLSIQKAASPLELCQHKRWMVLVQYIITTCTSYMISIYFNCSFSYCCCSRGKLKRNPVRIHVCGFVILVCSSGHISDGVGNLMTSEKTPNEEIMQTKTKD